MVRAYQVLPMNQQYGPAPVSVSSSVGVGGANLTEDVMVVQFLLKKYYLQTKTPYQGPYRLDQITGYCGEKTRALILDFQRRVRGKYSDAPYPDGRVDPDQHTINLLCAAFQTLYFKPINDMTIGS